MQEKPLYSILIPRVKQMQYAVSHNLERKIMLQSRLLCVAPDHGSQLELTETQ
jgi:hypothetical protein